MGYTRDAIKGVSWLGALRIFTRFLSFLRTLVVARVLSPSQFGVYGIADLVLSFIEIVTETGINVFLVQKKDEIGKYINTAWVVSILRGFVIFVAIFISSFAVAAFFKSGDVLPLLILISLVPLIRGFINPSIVNFQKNIEFHREFYYRSSIFLVETVVSVILVILMKEPLALIYGLIAGALFEVCISFVFIKPVPRFEFNKSKFAEILSYGKWITGAGIFSYLFQNGDNVVVGKLLGTASLGIYDMAYSIATLPVSQLSDIAARVTFPVYVKISEDRQRLRRAYFKTILFTTALAFPVCLMFLIFPNELILLFLGPNWIQAADILRVLSILALFQTVMSPTGSVFLAFGKQKYVTILSALSFIVMIVLIFPLIARFGLVGAGIAAIFGCISNIPLIVYYLLDVFNEKKNK